MITQGNPGTNRPGRQGHLSFLLGKGGKRVKTNIDVTDGVDVASAFMGRYINILCFEEKPFIDGMRQQDQEIQDNFTYFALGWLHTLSKCGGSKDKDEVALMARDVCRHMPWRPKLHVLASSGSRRMEVEIRDDAQVVQMMAQYLAADSKNAYQDFFLYGMLEDRVQQQTLARMSRNWLAGVKGCLGAQGVSQYCDGRAHPYL